MIDGIPPFPGVRVMPTGTKRYIAEILGVRIYHIEVFADTPKKAAVLVEGFDLTCETPSYDHLSISITDADSASEETGESIEQGQELGADDDDGRGVSYRFRSYTDAAPCE